MRRILLLITFIALMTYMCMALTVGKIQGPEANPDSPVRNIIYAHVPSSICALLCFIVILIASICYLATEKPRWENLGVAAAEVGALFIELHTGRYANSSGAERQAELGRHLQEKRCKFAKPNQSSTSDLKSRGRSSLYTEGFFR